jgi:hypothetical protein
VDPVSHIFCETAVGLRLAGVGQIPVAYRVGRAILVDAVFLLGNFVMVDELPFECRNIVLFFVR